MLHFSILLVTVFPIQEPRTIYQMVLQSIREFFSILDYITFENSMFFTDKIVLLFFLMLANNPKRSVSFARHAHRSYAIPFFTTCQIVFGTYRRRTWAAKVWRTWSSEYPSWCISGCYMTRQWSCTWCSGKVRLAAGIRHPAELSGSLRNWESTRDTLSFIQKRKTYTVLQDAHRVYSDWVLIDLEAQ